MYHIYYIYMYLYLSLSLYIYIYIYIYGLICRTDFSPNPTPTLRACANLCSVSAGPTIYYTTLISINYVIPYYVL